MGQHDYNIANQGAAAFRADLNDLADAVLSMNSGSSAPTDTAAGMLWYDSNNGLIKQRNAADNAWITLYAIDAGELAIDATTTQGDILASDGTNLVRLAVGTDGQILKADSGETSGLIWADLDASGYPTGYHGSAKPVYATAATFTVAYIRERNNDDDGDITKAGSTTVNLGTTGLNGIAQSSNLTGTVSVSSGAASVTGSGTTFTTSFQVGDVITTAGGNSRRITVITDNTNMTVESNWGATESGVNYKRGGEAPNTHYNLYAIDDGSTPGLILSTRNVAGGDTLSDLPAGYSDYRQMAFACTNDSSSDLIPFEVANWGGSPLVLYKASMSVHTGGGTTAGDTNVLAAGTSGTYASVDASDFVPPISKAGFITCLATYANAAYVSVRTDSTGPEMMAGGSAGVGTVNLIGFTSSQGFEYKRAAGSGSVSIDVLGFYVTEVQ